MDWYLESSGRPSPFYLFIAAFLDRTLLPGQTVRAPRLAPAALLRLGVLLALALEPKRLAVSSRATNDAPGSPGPAPGSSAALDGA